MVLIDDVYYEALKEDPLFYTSRQKANLQLAKRKNLNAREGDGNS